MFTTDDTEIIPADQSGDAPSPNGRALTAPAPRREERGPTAETPTTAPPRFLTALLRALSMWST